MSRTMQALLLARTVRHLAPVQVVHRVRLRGQKVLVQAASVAAARVLSRPVPEDVGWPEDFLPVDARVPELWPTVDLLAEGRIRLLGHERVLDDWRSPEPPQLWRYHLHYWDWAWSLALAEDVRRGRAVFERLLRGWQEQTRFGHWDEWSPYVVALRAWSWCGQYDRLVRETGFEREFLELLGLHQGYLRAHLELDVGGNHLIKNLKALVGLAVFFGDEAGLRRALRRLEREVRRQVLPDGGHYERAPAYHCQVLADLLDVEALLGQPAPPWLAEAVQRMRSWLGQVLLPDGSVPLLNDGFPVPNALVASLQPGPTAMDGLTVLRNSGLAVLRRGEWHLLADVGLPCPDHLPAHAQADTLGFLLYDGMRRVVGERFTSTYAGGAVRSSERGTAAHSTVQVDGVDSTEVWSAFRAGRRARASVHVARDDGRTLVLTASHDGYRHLPGRPIHVRTWEMSREAVHVLDEVRGSGEHELAVRFHGTAESAVAGASADLQQTEAWEAVGWEQRRKAAVLEHVTRARLPWHFEVALTRENV